MNLNSTCTVEIWWNTRLKTLRCWSPVFNLDRSGDMEVKALRIFYGLVTRGEVPKQQPLLVGRTFVHFRLKSDWLCSFLNVRCWSTGVMSCYHAPLCVVCICVCVLLVQHKADVGCEKTYGRHAVEGVECWSDVELHFQSELRQFQDHQLWPVGRSSASSHQWTGRGHHSRGRPRANHGSAACHDRRSADVRFPGPNGRMCTSNSSFFCSHCSCLWSCRVGLSWRTMTKMHNCWFHPAGWVIVLALLISGMYWNVCNDALSRFFTSFLWTMCSVSVPKRKLCDDNCFL